MHWGQQEQCPVCFWELFGKRYPGFSTCLWQSWAFQADAGWRVFVPVTLNKEVKMKQRLLIGDLLIDVTEKISRCLRGRSCPLFLENKTLLFLLSWVGTMNLLNRPEVAKRALLEQKIPLSVSKKSCFDKYLFLNLHASCMCLMTGKLSSLSRRMWQQSGGVTYTFLHSRAQTTN